MAQATATFTATVEGDWDPGKFIEPTNWKEQVLQNIEHISQTHGHDVDTANDGGRLRVKEAKDHWLLLGSSA